MKMSMMKRIFAILLTVAMLVCVLTACNASKDSAKTNSAFLADATQPTGADNAVLQKITSVNITCGKSAIENFAAAELRWYLAKKNIPLADDGYGIALKLDDSVAQNGYQIIADENGLVIAGGNERGLAYGLYAFLEKFVGVRIYSPDTEVIDDSDVMIGVGVLDTFDPAFEIIRNPWYPIERLAEKNGGNVRSLGITKTLALNALTGAGELQPCLSDPENLTKAVQTVKSYLSAVKSFDTLRFTPASEVDLYCTCENCTRIHEEEGSPAGVYVRFLNALTEAISVDYPDLQFELVIRAYLQKAPALTKLTDRISIRFNMEKCHISHPITDTTCPDSVIFAESVRGWSAICSSVHVEYGLTATVDYIPVFANLGAMRENMRFFAECGVDSINCSGNIVCPTGEFGELRVYLFSQLLQNPMMTEEEYYAHMDTFLEDYYGEGWTYIRKFIDKTIELAADGHQIAGGSPLDAITEEEYLANEAAFDEWWNQAEALAGDRLEFVKRARYQWRYIKLCLHPNAEDALALITDAAAGNRVGWRDKQWNVDKDKSNLDLTPFEWTYKS